MNRLEELYRDAPDAAGFARGYLVYVAELLERVDVQAVAVFTELLLDARRRGARIFFIGNGGSAATASHFANDIGLGTRSEAEPFRAVSLTDNPAVLTAIANDSGYDAVFVEQLRSLMAPGDVVVAISVSGNSPSVVGAVEYANACGGRTAALTGFDGGRLMEIAEVSVHVPTNPGEYGPAEDVHMVFDHLVGSFLALVCRSEIAVAGS
jgi:D-sedoheptulose 7-phosphate isomerase